MNIHVAPSGLQEILAAKKVHDNLSAVQLVELGLLRGEGMLTSTGAFRVETGKYTGRSPKDKFIVREPAVEKDVDWGAVNQPMSQDAFDRLYAKVLDYLNRREELYVFDGYAGADPEYQLAVRFVNEYAWQNLFVRQLFIRPAAEELKQHLPQFTVISVPGLSADPQTDGTRSETFIAVSFEKRVVLIGGTHYAGEMKKSIFSVLNYLLPKQGVLSMHCSANVGKDGDVALFFGLSGTGKTTLSTDPERALIGDDEHGWSDRGVFNFEGGCYAKCIRLRQEGEPEIWNAIRFGTVLENVVVEEGTRIADYDSDRLTENTRAAYPLEYIPGALQPSMAGHPKTIIFLTADATGVLPPIAKLTKEQAMYYFLSGYTSKLAGTERGVVEPEATFSTCFGAPFLPLAPTVYAELLGDKINRHEVSVFLVNTGWTGGGYGSGQRMKLGYTRKMVSAAVAGQLNGAVYETDPIFGLAIPKAVEGVPSEILHPKNTWADPDAYDRTAKQLAVKFADNFKKFKGVADSIRHAGPRFQ